MNDMLDQKLYKILERADKLKGKNLRESDNNFYIVVEGMYVEVEVDDFNQGLIGDRRLVLDKTNLGKARNMEDIYKLCSKYYDIPSFKEKGQYLAFEDGRITCSIHVDEDNLIANQNDLKDWRKGLKTLWLADIDIYIKFVKGEWTPSVEEISSTLGIQEY